MRKREYWLDYLRAFACILVTIGHLLMSFQDANIIREKLIVPTFIDLIYCFHVYIFFFCSGYLFQANKPKTAFTRVEKCINFLCLYILFSGITYVMKIIFSSSVNSAIEYSFLETLLKYPINQMWYLYAISVIFLFSKFIDSEKTAYIVLGAALMMKIISISGADWLIPVPINYLCQNMIWFVLGQLFMYKQIILSKIITAMLTLLFIVLFAYRTICDLDSSLMNTLLTLLGLSASTGAVYYLTNKRTATAGLWKYLSKYMLQIYLLHTIFAAGIRSVLLKLGITHVIPHIVMGLVFSFVIPITCAIIAERIWFLNIFFFPVKTVKRLMANKR